MEKRSIIYFTFSLSLFLNKKHFLLLFNLLKNNTNYRHFILCNFGKLQIRHCFSERFIQMRN